MSWDEMLESVDERAYLGPRSALDTLRHIAWLAKTLQHVMRDEVPERLKLASQRKSLPVDHTCAV